MSRNETNTTKGKAMTMTTPTPTIDAYAAGWSAEGTGLSRADNPFATNIQMFSDWTHGWDDGRQMKIDDPCGLSPEHYEKDSGMACIQER